MKKMRNLLAMGLVMVLLMTVAAPLAAAEEYYTYNDHTFAQGIDRVDCFNFVDADSYATLHTAVDTAILDWDWHLGLLNEQYGTSWDLVSFVGNRHEEVPMIECVAMTDAEYAAYAGSGVNDKVMINYYGLENGIVRSSVDRNTQNWYSVEIIFLVDQLRAAGELDDYAYLRSLANHEIGHALGLNHDEIDCGVIMYPNGDDRTAWVPTAKDLATVRYLYG